MLRESGIELLRLKYRGTSFQVMLRESGIELQRLKYRGTSLPSIFIISRIRSV
jgi:hypothetical protein